MDKIKICISTVYSNRSGGIEDCTRPVTFEGERLAQRHSYDDGGNTRGTTLTLYRTTDGRLIVHTKYWSQWQGEKSIYDLKIVADADLDAGGKYELLGREAGLARPLTLDEALANSTEEDYE